MIALLAGCELRPAPKPAPPAEAVAIDPASASAIADAAEPPAPVAVDAAVAVAADAAAPDDAADVQASPDCVATAEHIASVVIEGADPGARTSLEQSRDRMVHAMALGCTTHGWNADKQKCFQLAKLEADIHACEKMYPQPVADGSGAGSAR